MEKAERDYIYITKDFVCKCAEQGIDDMNVVSLLAKLISFCKKTGVCTVSNAYLCDWFHTSERTIRYRLSILKDKNLVIVKTVRRKENNEFKCSRTIIIRDEILKWQKSVIEPRFND